MAPQKGKQGTKGQKQIVEENNATLVFYRNMAIVSCAVYILVAAIVFTSYTWSTIFLFLFAVAIFIGCHHFMSYMAVAKYTDSGQLLDSGVDLNMEGGIAEHVKDLLILTAGCQVLSLVSNYFWLLWLLAPARGFWILWVNVLSPWFFQAAPPQEVDEKKQKKLERKMRRQQH